MLLPCFVTALLASLCGAAPGKFSPSLHIYCVFPVFLPSNIAYSDL